MGMIGYDFNQNFRIQMNPKGGIMFIKSNKYGEYLPQDPWTMVYNGVYNGV